MLLELLGFSPNLKSGLALSAGLLSERTRPEQKSGFRKRTMQVNIPTELVWLLCITVTAMSIPTIWCSFLQYGQAFKKQQEQQARYEKHLALSEEQQARIGALIDRHEAMLSQAEKFLSLLEDKLST
jgi:hypothetical protein